MQQSRFALLVLGDLTGEGLTPCHLDVIDEQLDPDNLVAIQSAAAKGMVSAVAESILLDVPQYFMAVKEEIRAFAWRSLPAVSILARDSRLAFMPKIPLTLRMRMD